MKIFKFQKKKNAILLLFSFVSLLGQGSKYGLIYKEILRIRQTNPDSALVIANSYASKIKDPVFQANISIQKSQCYSLLGERDKAIAESDKANKAALEIGDNELISRTFGLLANQLRNASLYQESNVKLKQGLPYVEKIMSNKDNYWIKSSFLREYSENLFEQNKIDSAIYYSHKALAQIASLVDDEKYNREKTYRHIIYNDLAKTHLAKNDLDSTQYFAYKAIANSENLENKETVHAEANLLLSQVYYKKGENEKAIEILKKLELSIPKEMLIYRAECYINLSRNYAAIDDITNSKKYDDLYFSIQNKLNDEDTKAINKLIKSLEDKHVEDNKKNQLKLLIAIIFSIVLLVCIVLFSIFLKKSKKQQKDRFDSYLQLLKTEKREETSKNEKRKLQKSLKISDDVEQNLLIQLQKFEESENFINPKITLPYLAGKLKTNTKYLSETIKKNKKQNFNTYINTLRINYITKKILTEEIYRKYKISYLAEHSGFTSADTFSSVFKNITGVSPSIFIENISNELSEKK